FMKKTYYNIYERSEEYESIIGNMSDGVTRWGFFIIGIFLIVIFSLLWFIRFLDVVVGPVLLTTKEPITKLVSQNNGNILHVFIYNNSLVYSSDVMLEFQNDVSYNTINKLSDFINTLDSNLSKDKYFLSNPVFKYDISL